MEREYHIRVMGKADSQISVKARGLINFGGFATLCDEENAIEVSINENTLCTIKQGFIMLDRIEVDSEEGQCRW